MIEPASNGAPPPPEEEGLSPDKSPASSTSAPTATLPIHPAHHAGLSTPPASSAGTSVAEPQAAPDTPSTASVTIAEAFAPDFMKRALLAAVLVCGLCGFLGVYVVLRRIVFVGITLSEFSAAGVAFAFLKGLSVALCSVTGMLIGVGFLSARWARKKVTPETFIGVGYVLASTASLLLIDKSPKGLDDLQEIISGNPVTVTSGDIGFVAVAAVLILLFHLLFRKEMLFAAFDPDSAEAAGYQVRFWDAALFVTIGLAIAFSIRAVGSLLTFSSLIVPAVSALLLTKRMGAAFAAAAVIGMLQAPIGLYLSYAYQFSTGPSIAAVGLVFLAAAWGVSRLRHDV